jgi:hypothetical protein
MDIYKGGGIPLYIQWDYLYNSNMTIPIGLAATWMHGNATEAGHRNGFPPVSRQPQFSPTQLVGTNLTKGRR